MTGSRAPRVVLHTRAGCHLCEPAAEVVRTVAQRTGAEWAEVDVDDPPPWAGRREELVAAFGDKVPAVTVDGALVAYWRISPDTVLRALDRPPR